MPSYIVTVTRSVVYKFDVRVTAQDKYAAWDEALGHVENRTTNGGVNKNIIRCEKASEQYAVDRVQTEKNFRGIVKFGCPNDPHA